MFWRYVTVFDGSAILLTTIPTSFDVGYKYATVFDGFLSNINQWLQTLAFPAG